MTDENIRNIYVHTLPESYKGLLDDRRTAQIEAISSCSPQLSELVIDIILEWRAATYAAALPATIPEQLKGFHDSFVHTGEVNTTLIRLAEGISGRLARRIPELTSDPALIRRLQAEIVTMGSDLEAAKLNCATELSLEEVWKNFLKQSAFYLGLWGSQRIAYVAIYNAYDNFISHLVLIALRLSKCRTNDKGFKMQLDEAFGDTLKKKCWIDHRVHTARAARHSLSHAGGRVTKELADLRPKHDFVVVDDKIQITPDNVRELVDLLSECVYTLSEKAATMPQFK